jgi:DNA invertase Pin-like site-specific DNA recombinase
VAPPHPRFVSYLRVSTDGQGRSGLGLEAQRQAVAAHVAQAGGEVVAEFREVESGKRADRPQLAAALASCRTRRAVLIIAKLDRLARNARFLLSVVEGSGEAGVVFCDLPTVPAGPVGKFLVTQMAAVAELEAGLISQRTRAALAVVKARGVRLGNPSPPPATAEISTRQPDVPPLSAYATIPGRSLLRADLKTTVLETSVLGRVWPKAEWQVRSV